ncbi:MAG TPA: hypothetical protein VN493_08795 [Thermoanaerobaculia bacterium]|nr:hypothetical protein [Thermoanaerobaculia bacterium]
MSATIDDFVGEWYIRWVDGEDPIVQKAWRLVLEKPSGSTLQFVLSQPVPGQGWQPVLSSDKNGPLEFVAGSLRWISDPLDTPPEDMARMYISVAEGVTWDEAHFRSLYGTTLHGDPEQVAVWGANDVPPPSPVAP